LNNVSTPGGALPELARLRVLISDQSAEDQTLLREALKGIGINNVRGCREMAKTMKAIELDAPNFILLELGETGATGLNFMRAVRAGKTNVPADVPIVIMSKTLDRDIAFKACNVGFENFIKKPITAESVVRRVTSTVQKPRRFVVGRGYFGPDRRLAASSAYNGPERREARHQYTNGTKPANGTVEAAVEETADKSSEKLPKQKPAPSPEKMLEKKPEAAKPQKREAARPAANKEAAPPQPKPTAAVEKPKAKRPESKLAEKEAIEVAESPETINEEDSGPDIAAILEDHGLWLTTGGAQGEKANLQGASLAGTDLTDANLANANLRDADLQDCILTGANFEDADLRGANLSGSNLAGAELHHAKLRHASLKAAQLPEAGLRGADLAGANLRGAGLTGADLKDANFLSTDICGAELLGVNLTQKQVDKARGDGETTFPPGIRLPEEK